jgi:hypothetical protein
MGTAQPRLISTGSLSLTGGPECPRYVVRSTKKSANAIATSGMRSFTRAVQASSLRLGFVAAVEEAFADQAHFTHAIAYDDGHPIACGSFCAYE